jgi:hypothetical protein
MKITFEEFQRAAEKGVGPIKVITAITSVTATMIVQKLAPALALVAAESKKARTEYENSAEGIAEKIRRLAAEIVDDVRTVPPTVKENVLVPIQEIDEALARDMRYWRVWGVNIQAATRSATGSLGDVIGGTLGDIVNFTETVPGLFDGVTGKVGETAAATAGMSDVWGEAMLSMTAGLVSFGDANATIMENVGKVFGNFIKSAIAGIEAMILKEIVAAQIAKKTDQAQAQSAAIKWIMKTFPFPFSLAIAAGSFALVNALFAKILKFEKGGYFPNATMLPAGAIVGEAGPEFILPERKLEAAIDRALGGRRGRSDTLAGPVTYAFNIQGPVLATTAALTDDMISSAANRLFREMENQARLRGRRLM